MADTLWSGTQADKLYKMSAFTSTLIDSVDVSAIGINPRGITENGTDTIFSSVTTLKLYKMSAFTSTLIDSLDISSLGTAPEGVTWACDDAIVASATALKLYRLVGFTTTIKDSVTLAAGLDAFGVSWNGVDVSWSGGNGAPDKLYRLSGFNATVLDSVDATGTLPSDISWDGTDAIWIDFNNDKLMKQSAFTSTLLDSFSVTAIDTEPHGLEHGDVTERGCEDSPICPRNHNRKKEFRRCRAGY